MSNLSIKKYRPSFTAAQLTCILSALASAEQTAIVQSTIRSLEVFKFKLDQGSKVEGYQTTKAQENIEAMFGTVEHNTSDTYANMTPAQKRANSYRKWRQNPLSCNQDEIDYAQTYGYENNLLTENEFVDVAINAFGCSREEALIEYKAGQITRNGD